MTSPRRRRVLAFLAKRFPGKDGKPDREKIIEKTGLTKGRVAQWFDEDEPFGENAGRNLALVLELGDEYYFEVDHEDPPGLSREEIDWAWKYHRLKPSERERFHRLVDASRDPSDTTSPADLWDGVTERRHLPRSPNGPSPKDDQ